MIGPMTIPLLTDGAIQFAFSDKALRDWFAGQALPEALARDYGNDWGKSGTEFLQLAAARAYKIADAMLAQRERGK